MLELVLALARAVAPSLHWAGITNAQVRAGPTGGIGGREGLGTLQCRRRSHRAIST